MNTLCYGDNLKIDQGDVRSSGRVFWVDLGEIREVEQQLTKGLVNNLKAISRLQKYIDASEDGPIPRLQIP